MKGKVPISERAAIQRLNRVLAKDGEMLKKSRPSKFFNELGEFYLLDIERNFIVEKDVDLEALAREHKALAAWEVLEKGGKQ